MANSINTHTKKNPQNIRPETQNLVGYLWLHVTYTIDYNTTRELRMNLIVQFQQRADTDMNTPPKNGQGGNVIKGSN